MSCLSEGSRRALYKDLLDDTWPRIPDVLLVGAALEELAETLEEVVQGRMPPQAGDRRSLACDLDLALTRVGKHLLHATSPPLKEFRTREVSNLASTLADRKECARVAALARNLLAQLDSADALKAAWDDVISTLADDSVHVRACLLAFDQLKELLHRRGHEWWDVRHGLYEPIRAGDFDAARAVVSESPPDDATVAWVVFANADLRTGTVRVGPVQFFNGWLELSDIRDGLPALNSPDFEPATELTDEAIESYFDKIVAEPIVYARVELAGERAKVPATRRSIPPLEWARHIAFDLVEAVGFRHGGSEWVLLDGGCYFTARGGGPRPAWPAEVDFPPLRHLPSSHPRYEPTGKALGCLQPGFADALVAEEEEALAALQAIHWHRDVERTDNPDMHVALHVRRFEVQWSTGDPGGWQTWNAPLRHFMRDLWCRDQQSKAFFWGGRVLLSASLVRPPADPVRMAAQEVHESTGGASFRINLNAMLRVAPEVAGDFLSGSFERRFFKELSRRTRSPAAAQVWWRELRPTFDVLLNRAVRQRNRVIHGREPVPEVIRTVDGFISGLSATLAGSAVHAAAEHRDLDAVLEDERKDVAHLFETLTDEANVLALFSYRAGHAFYELSPVGER